MSRRRIVLATGNRGKLAELSALLADEPVELVTQDELGVSAADETGSTFVENAIIKARHAAAVTGLPALADDSGLAVDALAGLPGVRSARYAGPTASDTDNVRRLLDALDGVEQRDACFLCVTVLLRHADDPAPIIAQGEWHGRIATQALGDGGFGYDPVFVPRASTSTAAAMPAAEKNKVSHRGRALAALREPLRNFLVQ